MSLRLRLLILILAPLTVLAILLGYWRYSVAKTTAETLFDRSLLASALAISRDVAISGGDALLPSTFDMLRDVAGGEVFYHVTGPDGIYVTGYAYPPRAEEVVPETALYLPHFFEASYRGEGVRVVQLTERTSIGTMIGDSRVTVWQRLSDRSAFAWELALRAAALMGALLIALALLVWFGVRMGLRPLDNLHAAIASRSPDDLSTIKRPVPREVEGIVATLNTLFGRVRRSIDAHQDFISDAAHQLRNPAAAVLSMAESARAARHDTERLKRLDQVINAAREASRVAEQLLSLDRLRDDNGADGAERFDLAELAREVTSDAASPILAAGIELEFDACADPLAVRADRRLLAEALKNLLDNAMKHGGAQLARIAVSVRAEDGRAVLSVADDGFGLRPEDAPRAFRRFGQIRPGSGSGLGLAIAASVARRHGGDIGIDAVDRGASLSMWLPLAA